MYTEYGILKKNTDSLTINNDNTKKIMFIIININNSPIAPKINIATGECRKPKEKKLFNFCVKNDGTILISVI